MLKVYLLVLLFAMSYMACVAQKVEIVPGIELGSNKADSSFKEYLGIYHSMSSPILFTIVMHEGKLMIQVEGRSPFPLKQIGQNCFELDNAGSELQFDPINNNMLFKQGGREFLFEKIR